MNTNAHELDIKKNRTNCHKKIRIIEIKKLMPHPDNPNHMSKAIFKKLVGHIERAGNYEPVIVRVHPEKAGRYQILNGHHRVKALESLGIDRADCVVWDVDDNESLVLLATLNRLTGNDQLQSKSKLIKSLTKCIDIKELAKQLPDNKKAIERLTSLVQKDYIYPDKKPLSLGPMVFFLDDEQTELIDLALAKAGQNTPEGTRAQKKAAAFVKISKAYLLQPAG